MSGIKKVFNDVLVYFGVRSATPMAPVVWPTAPSAALFIDTSALVSGEVATTKGFPTAYMKPPAKAPRVKKLTQ